MMMNKISVQIAFARGQYSQLVGATAPIAMSNRIIQ